MTPLKQLQLIFISVLFSLLNFGLIGCTSTLELNLIPTQKRTSISQIALSASSTPIPKETTTVESILVPAATSTASPVFQPSSTPRQRRTQTSQIAQIEFSTPTPFTSATAAAVLSPYEPLASLPTSSLPYPTRQPTKTPEPTATTDSASFAQRSGLPEIDLIIEAIESRDKEALRALISFTTFKCTNVGGIGGAPKCWAVGGKKFNPPLPEGTELELLPIGAPIWWPLPETIDSSLDQILGYPKLEAVYKAKTNSYLSAEEGWPVSDTAIVLSHGGSQIALLVKDGRIVIIDFPDPWENWSHEIGDYLIPHEP
ncbi:MAG: hypothetical protein AB8G95_23055 [Anaerolineae bacterium]